MKTKVPLCLQSGTMPPTVVMAESDSCSSARGHVDPKTHVRGINIPWEGCNWASTLSSSGRHPGFRYTYYETVVDRQKVTNLRLPGQYDERLLSSLGLQGPYYNWNRWYLPGVGRYLELDPIAMRGGPNGEYGPDWYGYAAENPLRFIDVTGLSPLECAKKVKSILEEMRFGDALAHCLGGCGIAKDCSPFTGWLAAFGKELMDLFSRGRHVEWRDVQNTLMGVECGKQVGVSGLRECNKGNCYECCHKQNLR